MPKSSGGPHVGHTTPWKPTRPVKGDDTHECPAPWCARRVPSTMFACRQDWYGLPQHLRDAIWAGYRNQSDGGAAHRLAMATAIQFYRDNPR